MFRINNHGCSRQLVDGGPMRRAPKSGLKKKAARLDKDKWPATKPCSSWNISVITIG
jgi:hypothetical protein